MILGIIAQRHGGPAEPPGPPWTPEEITTTWWLDAADDMTITLVSGKVSEWRDKSGNAQHATQGTDAARPTLQEALQNGRNAIRWATVNQLNMSVPQASGQHVFLAGDTSSIGSGDRLFLNRSSGGVSNLAAYFGRSGRNFRPDLFWNNTATANWPTAVNRKALWRWHYKTGTPAHTLMQVDGETPVTADVTASALTNWNSINLTATQQSAFDAYEIIITPDIDSDTIDKVFGYLAHKWGLASLLPGGHPYKSAPPTP